MIADFFEGLFSGVKGLAATLTFVVLLLLVGGYVFAYYQSEHIHEACMVEDKESVNTGDGHEYRVYTDCGNFVVQDELLTGNFYASDTYADLEEGHAYDLRTRGWRFGFLSWFPNIYQATPTGETAR